MEGQVGRSPWPQKALPVSLCSTPPAVCRSGVCSWLERSVFFSGGSGPPQSVLKHPVKESVLALAFAHGMLVRQGGEGVRTLLPRGKNTTWAEALADRPQGSWWGPPPDGAGPVPAESSSCLGLDSQLLPCGDTAWVCIIFKYLSSGCPSRGHGRAPGDADSSLSLAACAC